MSGQHRRQFDEIISQIESERTISLMEAELEYHRKMSMMFAKTLESEQRQLSNTQKRQGKRRQMQNGIRDTFQHLTGEDDLK